MSELKDLVFDDEFVKKIRAAFTNLKDDISFELNTSREKIKDLRELHVDNNQFLSKLIENSKDASGIIYGERGTGKTHLFLLANEDINSTISENKVLSIYINLKNIGFPEIIDQELFNRIFSIHIYEQVYLQLIRLLKDVSPDNFSKQIKLIFNKSHRDFIAGIKDCLNKLMDFINICYLGGKAFSDLNVGVISTEENAKNLNEICDKLNVSADTKELKINYETVEKYMEESSSKLAKQNNYISFLNIEQVKKNLIALVNILGIDTITFYIDEWEKIYSNNVLQQYTANYIDKLNGKPVYFWIGVVPNRGSLYQLVTGSDLPHEINLDTSLIYEASEYEKSRCISYFKEFVNGRLDKYVKSYGMKYDVLFKDDKAFEQLVIASMGNSRDFGLMLVDCIDNYLAYRKEALVQGRPFKYINLDMIEDAIKSNGQTKKNNIVDKINVAKILKDIENFCFSRSSSHLAIEVNKDNIEALNNKAFSDLFYYRLLHLRKIDVPSKEGDVEKRLNIYSLDYSSTYNLHKNEKKFAFILDYAPIHDKVRRYIYNPKTIIDELNVSEGKSHKCKSCGETVDIERFQKLWDKNTCPYCLEKIYND